MKNEQLANNRKFWNQQHARLRRLLEKEHDLAQALYVFSIHHVMVHSARLKVGEHGSFQDDVLRGLSDARMRAIPAGKANSIAWMLWHMTRIEDATMNVLIADALQVFQRGHWQAKIVSPFVDVGSQLPPSRTGWLVTALDRSSIETDCISTALASSCATFG